MKEIKHIALSILIIIALGMGIKLLTYSENPTDAVKNDYLLSYKKEYKIFSPPLPTKLDFCGEGVPLDTFYVSEQLDREILVNTYWHSNALLLFKRANRWLPVIEPILRENKVPDDFKYLALIESGLQNITSPAGAKGYWQLMEKTAKQYGLIVNKEVDERYNVEKATVAACKYLKDAHQRFGSWTLAAASYNMGMGGLNKRLTQQEAKSYYDLLLNEETARYIYRTLAIKVIFNNPSKYGFTLREMDLYPPLSYHTVEVDSSVTSWLAFAQEQNISYKLLKELNPWLRTTKLTNSSRRTYQIKIPNKEMFEFQETRSKMSDKTGVFGEE
jgi:hypothetical protein